MESMVDGHHTESAAAAPGPMAEAKPMRSRGRAALGTSSSLGLWELSAPFLGLGPVGQKSASR